MAREKTQSKKLPTADLVASVNKKIQQQPKRSARPSVACFKYQKALISYLDVLGMKDLLAKAGGDANRVASVLSRFRAFVSHDGYAEDLWKTQFVNFSDLAVRILPVQSEANVKYRMGGFFHEMQDLGLIQMNLIYRGILVRGAVVIGEICHQDGLTFGPGLADGYLKEGEAKFPRIIVAAETIRAVSKDPTLRGFGNSFRQEMAYLRGYLRKDVDDVWFLDYLAMARTDCDSNEQYGEFLIQHKKLIEQQRAEIKALPKGKRKQRLEKLKWMIALHREHLVQNDPESFLHETGVMLRTCQVSLWR